MKHRLAVAGLVLASAIPVAWAAGALYFDLPAGPVLRTAVTLVWILGVLAVLGFVRPLWHTVRFLALGFVVILVWWLNLRPRQDRAWQPDVAVLAHATVAGERVTLHDVRDIEYRTESDFTPRYADKTYDLANLRGLDVFQCYWGSEWIAHPIFSFDFGPDGHVCFSIETRKEIGEGYSTLAGVYRGFELIYIVAEERDVVRVRTNFRKGEDVYRFRLSVPPASLRELFLSFVHRIDELYARPEFYNVITANCTTSIRLQQAPEQRTPFDYRLLLNGKADELLYERGALDRSVPFAELKRRGHVNARALALANDADFSAGIRADETH